MEEKLITAVMIFSELNNAAMREYKDDALYLAASQNF